MKVSTYTKLRKAHPELEADLQRMSAEDVTYLLGRQTHTCPICLKVLQMSDAAWNDHFGLHVRIQELEEVSQ